MPYLRIYLYVGTIDEFVKGDTSLRRYGITFDDNIDVMCKFHGREHGLRTPREEKAFTAQPKIQSQIFRYDRSIFCLPHQPNFSDIFDLCLHWVSIVCGRETSSWTCCLIDTSPKQTEILFQQNNTLYNLWH
jgi:hypothetical protein